MNRTVIVIENLYFEDCESLVSNVIRTYETEKKNDEYASVGIVTKFEKAEEIIRELVFEGYDIALIEGLGKPDYVGYDDEFLITLDSEGIWCEKIKNDKGYYYLDNNVVYLLDDCSSKIIPYIRSNAVFEVNVGENDFCENKNYETENEEMFSEIHEILDKLSEIVNKL